MKSRIFLNAFLFVWFAKFRANPLILYSFILSFQIVGDTLITTHLNGERVELYALVAGTHVFTSSVSFTSDLVSGGKWMSLWFHNGSTDTCW